MLKATLRRAPAGFSLFLGAGCAAHATPSSNTNSAATAVASAAAAPEARGTVRRQQLSAVCAPFARAQLSDFSNPRAQEPGAVLFGEPGKSLSGGVFVYPEANARRTRALRSDTSQGDWHVQGVVGDYSGFGVYWLNCNQVDASAYGGFSFTLRGRMSRGSMITLTIGTAGNEVSHAWLESQGQGQGQAAEFGRCIPAQQRFDGSCAPSSIAIPVSAEPAARTVRWDELSGGSPEAAVNPAEITQISWSLPVPDGAGTPDADVYDVDLHIDDLAFFPR